MCLGIPAQITAIETLEEETHALLRQGWVKIGSVAQPVYLGCVPEAKVGDYILLHAGIAIAKLDLAQAQRILADLSALADLEQG